MSERKRRERVRPQSEASAISVNCFRCNLGVAFRFVTRRSSESNAGATSSRPN